MSKKFKFLLSAIKRGAKLCAALFGLLIISCSVMSFEEFKTSVSVGESQNYFNGKYVALLFSIEVNPGSAQRLISLKEDGSSCEINTIWTQKACLVQARGGFKKGRKYSISFDGELLTSDGRNYSVSLFREFIFGTARDIFYPTKIQEPDKKNPQGALTFIFNKPVDAAVFEREFNLSPSLDVKKNYSADMTRVEITPADKWKANCFYAWKLGKLCALDGAKINANHSGSFMAVQKTEPPKLLFLCPVLESGAFLEGSDLNGLFEKQAVGLVFDSDMDFDSVQSGVYWSPYIAGSWTKKDPRHFSFAPYQNYKIDEEYTLTISDSIKDVFGLNLKQSERASFKTQSDFITAKVFLNGIPLAKNELNAINAAQGCPLIFSIDFSRALDKKSVAAFKNAVSLAPHFPLDIAIPNMEAAKFFAGNESSAQAEFGNFDFSEAGEEKIYVFKIKGGENFIYDAYGEYLKEDACFYISLER